MMQPRLGYNLLKDLKDEEKGKEEKEYPRVAEGNEGYIEALMEANELVARLETRLKVITRIKERSRITALPVRETETMVNPNARMQPGGPNPELTSQSWGENLRVNLPKLQLPVFDGNLQHWQEFWDIYKAIIHDQQTLPAVSQFSYLKECVERVSTVSNSRNTSYK